MLSILLAGKALGLHLWGIEKDNENIPAPSNPPFADMPEGAVIVPVVVFPDIVKNEMDNKAVKTNVTLPSWLKELAEKQQINFSQVLQSALKEYLEISHKWSMRSRDNKELFKGF